MGGGWRRQRRSRSTTRECAGSDAEGDEGNARLARGEFRHSQGGG